MPKIKREPKEKKFNNLSPNLTKYLFDFFSYKELYEMGKTNIYFMNNIIDYINENEPWPEKIRKFKSKYNSKIIKVKSIYHKNKQKYKKEDIKFIQLWKK